jgi:hypothetical protein
MLFKPWLREICNFLELIFSDLSNIQYIPNNARQIRWDASFGMLHSMVILLFLKFGNPIIVLQCGGPGCAPPTCKCGLGHFNKSGKWISGDDVRSGRAPPPPGVQLQVCLSVYNEAIEIKIPPSAWCHI